MNVKETTGHQRQQDIINVARRVTMLINTGQLEHGYVAEMTAFLLDLRVTTVKKYTGFVPQLKYRQGHTYGSLTHKILVDPAVSRSEKLIVSDRSADEYQVLRPPREDVALVEGRLLCGDVIYRHPAVPGYEGFVPQLRSHLGQRFSVAATEALAGFQKQQLRDRQALNLLRHHASLQEGRHRPRRLGDRQMLETQLRMPLSVVRPEMAGVVRKVPVTEPYLAPPSHSSSPYFLHVGHPDKHFMSGHTGHVPGAREQHGLCRAEQGRAALDAFTENQRWRRGTEWAPVSVARPDPPLLLRPRAIHQRHVGQLPGYQGHVPGAKFRYGQTYGNDSVDGLRWLRGDFS